MKKIVVLGGSGFVGRAFCEQYVALAGGAGRRITVPSHQPQRAKALLMLPTVDVVRADVHDPADLARVLRGADAVVNLVGILHGSVRQFEQAHVELPRQLVAACAQAGVTRVVHVSALGADSAGPSRYQRSKAAGEALLQQSPLALTVLRPSVMFGEEDRFMNLFASLQRVFPVLPVPGTEARFQPVWVDDVARAIVKALQEPRTIGQTYQCTGPRVYTLGELVQLAGRWSGHERSVLPLPDGLGRLQAALMEWMPGQPLMSRDNIDFMRTPNVASPTLPGLDTLGIEATRMESVMPEAMSDWHMAQRLDVWRRQTHRT